MTSWPPRCANVSIQPAIFTRWSTDCAYPSSLPTQSIARCVGPRVVRAGGGDRDAESFDLRGLGLPEVQLEIALVLQCRVEHALRRHDPAGTDLVRRPVGHQGDLVPLRLEAEGELETGLTGSDDEYLPHAGDYS